MRPAKGKAIVLAEFAVAQFDNAAEAEKFARQYQQAYQRDLQEAEQLAEQHKGTIEDHTIPEIRVIG